MCTTRHCCYVPQAKCCKWFDQKTAQNRHWLQKNTGIRLVWISSLIIIESVKALKTFVKTGGLWCCLWDKMYSIGKTATTGMGPLLFESESLTKVWNYFQSGTYSNATHCIPCEIGHFCPSQSNKPQPCAIGTYSNVTGSVTCKVCPAGYSCLNPALNPVPCGAGEYSIAGQSACKVMLYKKDLKCCLSTCFCLMIMSESEKEREISLTWWQEGSSNIGI
jgi:hypothetical protein